MDDKKIIAIRHFDLSDNFFDLVEAILSETIRQGNNMIYFSRPNSDLPETQSEYKERTKWSDNRVIIPVLFNFFHGIELYLKASKYLLNLPAGKINHKLSDLYNDFKTNYPNKATLLGIFDYYIYPNANLKILYDFYTTNKLSDSSEFYETFKYPYNLKFTTGFDYKDLRNNGQQSLKIFEQIIIDIEILKAEKKLL